MSVLAAVLALAYTSMVPLTTYCLTMAFALGLGTGAVFKLVPEWFPDRVGSVTGVSAPPAGLGGFVPALVRASSRPSPAASRSWRSSPSPASPCSGGLRAGEPVGAAAL